MTQENVLYSENGPVATISLNRPETMNASNYAMRAELSEAMDRAEKNPAILAVVLTGEGRGFSSGADLTEGFTTHRGTINEHILKDHARLIDNIVQSDKTYIAALAGPTAGVSLAYALACDMILMAEDAFLYSPFAAISLVPDGGASWHLYKAFGYHRAFEIMAGMRRVPASECLAAGLATAVVPTGELRAEAESRAQKLVSGAAPLSLKYIKKLLHRAEAASREEMVRMEADFQFVCAQAEDHKEGVQAFLQKRKPAFKGR